MTTEDHCWWCHRLLIQEGCHLITPFTLGAPEVCDANPDGHESTNDILEAAERYEQIMRLPLTDI